MKKIEEETAKEVVALISSRKHKHLDRLDCAFSICLSLYFQATKDKDEEYVDEINKHILRLLNSFKFVIVES